MFANNELGLNLPTPFDRAVSFSVQKLEVITRKSYEGGDIAPLFAEDNRAHFLPYS